MDAASDDRETAPEPGRWPEDVRLAQLFGDALRLRVLVECNARETSPQSFHARVGGTTLAKVTEAFELLAHYEWIVPARTEKPGAEEERFYTGPVPPIISTEQFAQLPDSIGALIFSRIFEALTVRTKEAMKAGTLVARPDTHLTWTPLELDQQGWSSVIAGLDALFAALPQKQERARERMAQSGEEPIAMTVALLGFESPGEPERKFS